MLVRSAGKAGQGPSSIFETASPSSDLIRSCWPGRDEHVAAVVLDPAAEPLEGELRHAQVVGHAVADAELAAGAGGQRDERADLDVVRPDRVVGAAELLLTVDDHQVRADALDARAHLHQQAGEVLYVRLGSGVVDHGRAGRQRGSHQGVLGRHHRRLVHEEVAGVEPVRRVQVHVGAVEPHVRPERSECVEVRIEAAAADHVPAGRRHVGAAEAGEQRTRQQERRADALGPFAIDVRMADAVGTDRHDVLVAPLGLDVEPAQQLEHRLDVADPRDVAEHDLLTRQQRRGEHGQRGILVSSGHDGPGEGSATLDDELLHAGIRSEA